MSSLKSLTSIAGHVEEKFKGGGGRKDKNVRGERISTVSRGQQGHSVPEGIPHVRQGTRPDDKTRLVFQP